MDRLLRFDEVVFRAINSGLSNRLLDYAMWALSYSGLGQVQFLAVLLFLRWQKTRYYVLPLLVTIIFSGMIVAQGVKRLMERDRPSNLFWVKPQEEFYASSFPSGHTTTSFAVAAMLVLLTYRTPHRWLGVGALVWACLVGISRVYRGVHWPTDVLAGGCAGVFSACVVYLVLGALGRQLHLEEDGVSLSGQTNEPREQD